MGLEQKEMIPIDEAIRETEMASRRIGLLHLAFAKTLVNELGEDAGRVMILKAIEYYGKLVGEKAKEEVLKQGLDLIPSNFSAGTARDLPRFGMHEGRVVSDDGDSRSICTKGCAMAKVWRELGEEDLGALYCYVDPAKYMYYNPNYKLVHKKAMPVTGGDICEFIVEMTTEEERESFSQGQANWVKIDGNIEKRQPE
jgi:hypothetical protein